MSFSSARARTKAVARRIKLPPRMKSRSSMAIEEDPSARGLRQPGWTASDMFAIKKRRYLLVEARLFGLFFRWGLGFRRKMKTSCGGVRRFEYKGARLKLAGRQRVCIYTWDSGVKRRITSKRNRIFGGRNWNMKISILFIVMIGEFGISWVAQHRKQLQVASDAARQKFLIKIGSSSLASSLETRFLYMLARGNRTTLSAIQYNISWESAKIVFLILQWRRHKSWRRHCKTILAVSQREDSHVSFEKTLFKTPMLCRLMVWYGASCTVLSYSTVPDWNWNLLRRVLVWRIRLARYIMIWYTVLCRVFPDKVHCSSVLHSQYSGSQDPWSSGASLYVSYGDIVMQISSSTGLKWQDATAVGVGQLVTSQSSTVWRRPVPLDTVDALLSAKHSAVCMIQYLSRLWIPEVALVSVSKVCFTVL